MTSTAASIRSKLGRIFSLANLVGAGVAFFIFLGFLAVDGSNLAIIVGAIAGGVCGAAAWYVLAPKSVDGGLHSAIKGIPFLGAIPDGEAKPAPALSSTETYDRYAGLLREVEGQTNGRVLLVSSPGPGQGASTVALNLAIAAARAGRRVMLIDADPSPNGLGRFLSTGREPGLSDVAEGTATLKEATRFWSLDDGSQFPMLPSGAEPTDLDALSGVLVADALDAVSEHADLILIDVPPVAWSDTTPRLSAHADGTILVLRDSADPDAVSTAVSTLTAAGAPPLGYVRNRTAARAIAAPHWLRRAAIRAGVLGAVLLAILAAYTAIQLLYSWNRVETQTLDVSAVDSLLAEGPVETASPDDAVELEDPSDSTLPAPASRPAGAYETMLIIGSDEIANASDVILYLVRPTNGADPFMVSLPRDLLIKNPCTGGEARINTLIKGCPSKDINGPTLLSSKVAEITGIAVDHFAWFHFDGFVDVIDAVGGVELCFDNPVRDPDAGLDMPAGCTQADGQQTLSWVRSRKTEEFVDGIWRTVPGRGDLARNQHQQDVILELFVKLKRFSSPKELTTKVASVSQSFILDEGLSLTGAVQLAWRLRSTDVETIRRIALPVRLTRTTKGQSVLVQTQSFDQLLLDEYGDTLPEEDLINGENAALG